MWQGTLSLSFELLFYNNVWLGGSHYLLLMVHPGTISSPGKHNIHTGPSTWYIKKTCKENSDQTTFFHYSIIKFWIWHAHCRCFHGPIAWSAVAMHCVCWHLLSTASNNFFSILCYSSAHMYQWTVGAHNPVASSPDDDSQEYGCL